MSDAPRVLVLGTYSIANPRYGGPLRARAIVDTYEKACLDVRYVGIYPQGISGRRGRYDLSPSPAVGRSISAEPWLTDVLTGLAVSYDPHLRQRLERIFAAFQPHIVQFEEPYVFFGLCDWLHSVAGETKVVYSAYNVESTLKRELYKSIGLPARQTERLLRLIEEMELHLTKLADLVVAVTKSDAAYFSDHGARCVLIARNGTTPRKANPARVALWRHRLRRLHIEKTAVFVGSAHPPNWDGFLHFIGTKMGFLPRGSAILVCGGVCRLARDHHFQDAVEEATFWQRVHLIPSPSDEDLSALLNLASAVLVPIRQGGGSNLKTAEALVSERPVVVSPQGLRGFEEFARLSQVYTAVNPDDFRTTVRMVLSAPPIRPRPEEKRLLRELEWSACLAQLPEAVLAL